MSNPLTDSGARLRELTEDALLRRIHEAKDERSVDRAASELLGRHGRTVYVWCHRYLRDHERALDLSQEVLLAAYRGLPRFDGRCSVSSWLFIIARNRCLNEMARPQLLLDPELEPDELQSARYSPERVLLDQEDEDEVLALIRQHLDPIEQQALWMRCFERMPVEAITAALGLSDRSGARAVLQRARRKLRSALDEREEGERTWTGTA